MALERSRWSLSGKGVQGKWVFPLGRGLQVQSSVVMNRAGSGRAMRTESKVLANLLNAHSSKVRSHF